MTINQQQIVLDPIRHPLSHHYNAVYHPKGFVQECEGSCGERVKD
jgi:hypothetical protein